MPPFDKDALNKLVADLESGEEDLSRATDVNTMAQAAAAKAQEARDASQKRNLANVKAIKDYVASLADDGSTPDKPSGPVTDPNAGGGGTDAGTPAGAR